MKVKFLNWWSDGRDDFFYLFVKNYIDSNAILSEDPDILFCSVFGERDTIVNYLKTYHRNMHMWRLIWMPGNL